MNAISAGFLTGGVLAARAGPKAALMNAAIGGVLLGLIEGVSFLFGRYAEAPAAAPPVPGMGSPALAGGFSNKNIFANLQPQRTLTTSLDDPTAQYLSLDDEDTTQFNSTSATQLDPSNADTISSSPAPPSSFLTFGAKPTKKPVFAAAVEFSTDDFAFDDADDFEDEQQ